MGQEVSHTLLIRESFSLFEEFSAVVEGWDLDFCQLGPARGAFFLEQMAGSQAMISRAQLPARFQQRGCSTPGYRTLSILTSRDHAEAWRWCGETVTRNSLLVMPVGGEFESISLPDFGSIHLALSVEILERIAAERFDLPLYQLMPEERCFCAQGGVPLMALRQLLENLTTGPEGQAHQLSLTSELEEELVYLALACLDQNAVRSPGGARGKRRQTLERALQLIEGGELHRPDVQGLAAEAGVSRRTLENAFRDGLGVSPAAYLKARRLCGLGHDLYHNAGPATRVAEFAEARGFHHLGQLAADYRAMFGELPSDTLKRRV